MKKRIISTILCIISVFSVFTMAATTAAAANYTTSYGSYAAPSSSDYAYWNGKKVCKASGTTTSEIKWMQAALNYCIQNRGLSASKLNVDGSFGPASKQTTLAFQRKYGLSADGSFGPATISKMKTVLNPQKGTETTIQNTAAPSLIWPLENGQGTVSHKAGEVRSSHKHAGTDIAATSGTAILAIADGEVLYTIASTGEKGYRSRGYCVVIKHGNYFCVYQHMKSAPKVSKGEKVSQGKVIGYVGNTGESYGAHLHFEIAKYDTLKKTGTCPNYLYNDINNNANPTYYSISRGSQSGSYYSLNLDSHI